MEYNFKGVYSPTGSYAVKDVVSFSVNNVTKYYFCLQPNSSTNAQSPSADSDTQYWGLINSLSNFPNSIDTFLTRSPIQYNDKQYLQRFQELSLKNVLSTPEQTELEQLTQRIRDKLILPEDFNALQQSITNMQMFFQTEIMVYWQSVKDEINQTKTDAIQAIEDKKESIIDYLDSTEVGAIRNDVGNLNELQTVDKSSIVKALNEVRNDQPDASTTQKGLVKLNDTVTSTSVTEASTANATKTVNDLANSKYTKPANGIPKSDLDVAVQISLGKADSALQTIPSATTTVRGGVILTNSPSSNSTATVPSSNALKQVYDLTNANLYPPGGNVGDVLLKTANGVEWANPILLQSARYLYNRGISYINFERTNGGGLDMGETTKYIQCTSNFQDGFSFHSSAVIDLTPYSVIRFVIAGAGNRSTSLSIGVATSKVHSNSTDMVKVYSLSNISSTTEIEGSITVADLTGSYFLRFFGTPLGSEYQSGMRVHELELLR